MYRQCSRAGIQGWTDAASDWLPYPSARSHPHPLKKLSTRSASTVAALSTAPSDLRARLHRAASLPHSALHRDARLHHGCIHCVRKTDPWPIYFGFWCLMTNTTKLD